MKGATKVNHVIHLEDVKPWVGAADDPNHPGSEWYILLGDNVGAKRIGLAYVTLKPGGHTVPGTHNDMEQAFYFTKGRGTMMVDGKEYKVRPGTAVHVPLNTTHNYKNTSNSSLSFLVIESSPRSKKWVEKD
jgi:mannose-6-phosphate isomerase-like protein (cupin superfamily)